MLGDGKSHWVAKAPLGLTRRVGRRDRQRQAGRGDRLAVAAGLGRGHGRVGPLHPGPRRPRDRGAGDAEVRPAGRQARRLRSRRCSARSRASRSAPTCGGSSSSSRPARSPRSRASRAGGREPILADADGTWRARRSALCAASRAARGSPTNHWRSTMKAVCWNGVRDVRVETVPDPHDHQPARRDHPGHVHRHLRVGPAPVRRVHPDHEGRRHPRPRVHGRGGRGRPGGHEPQGRRPGRGPVHHRLRRAASSARSSSGRCATTPTRTPGSPEKAVRVLRVGPVRVLAHLRRVRRRAGRVRPRAVRRRRADQGARRTCPTSRCCS